MNRKFYNESRYLFTIVGCPHCRVFKEFIEKINFKLPLTHRIHVVDCTNYYDHGIAQNPIILRFEKFIKGSFPTLIFDGFIMQGSANRDELESFINNLVLKEYYVPVPDKFQYDRDCTIVKDGAFKNRIHCA